MNLLNSDELVLVARAAVRAGCGPQLACVSRAFAAVIRDDTLFNEENYDEAYGDRRASFYAQLEHSPTLLGWALEDPPLFEWGTFFCDGLTDDYGKFDVRWALNMQLRKSRIAAMHGCRKLLDYEEDSAKPDDWSAGFNRGTQDFARVYWRMLTATSLSKIKSIALSSNLAKRVLFTSEDYDKFDPNCYCCDFYNEDLIRPYAACDRIEYNEMLEHRRSKAIAQFAHRMHEIYYGLFAGGRGHSLDNVRTYSPAWKKSDPKRRMGSFNHGVNAAGLATSFRVVDMLMLDGHLADLGYPNGGYLDT
jgi:hypothetical protein